MNTAIIILILTVCKIYTASGSSLKIEVTSGGFFEEILGITGYEKSLPLIYNQKYNAKTFSPNLYLDDSTNQCDKDLSWTACSFLHTCNKITENLQTVLNDDIKYQHLDMLTLSKNNRNKRGIQFMGDALNWCCNVITTQETAALYENEETIKQNYDNLKDSIITSHAELLNVTTELTSFSTEVNKNFKNLYEDMKTIARHIQKDSTITAVQGLQQTMLNVLNLIQTQLNNNYHKEITEHCKEGRISALVVPPQKLEEDLLELESNLKVQNLELAIPTTKIIKYYTSKLTRCELTEDTLIIQIKVPIKTKNAKWKLFDYIPIHYRHENELCILHTDHALVAYDESSLTLKTISGTGLKKCNIDSGLCYIDYFEPNQDDSPRCIKNIFLEKPFSEINSACNFRCEPLHDKIIVKRIKSNTYVISNPQDSLVLQNHITNTNKTLTLNMSLTGTIKITLPCENSLKFINASNPDQFEILIPRLFPCSKFEKEVPIINRILPVQWTNLDTAHFSSMERPSLIFSDLNKIINKNWKETVPNFNIRTSQKEFENKLKNLTLKHIPHIENKFLLETIVTLWLGSLSILVTFFGLILWKLNTDIKYLQNLVHPDI